MLAGSLLPNLVEALMGYISRDAPASPVPRNSFVHLKHHSRKSLYHGEVCSRHCEVRAAASEGEGAFSKNPAA